MIATPWALQVLGRSCHLHMLSNEADAGNNQAEDMQWSRLSSPHAATQHCLLPCQAQRDVQPYPADLPKCSMASKLANTQIPR